MQIFAFKNKSTYTLNNTEYQRSLLKKSLIPLPNLRLKYVKTILSFLPQGNLHPCSLPFPTEKLNPYSASTAIPPPLSFLSKSDFSPCSAHRMVPLLKRRRRGWKTCYYGERKGDQCTELRGRNAGIWLRKGNKPSSSSSFPYPTLLSILMSSPFLHSSKVSPKPFLFLHTNS